MNIGVVGGSGLYRFREQGPGDSVRVETPFGAPSGPFTVQKVGEHTVFFLARHGEGHVLSPSEINYRANIYGFKHLGVRHLVSVSAVGSLRSEIAPGHLVFPDQYIDRTTSVRAHTFFGGGVVGHAHFADPACSTLRQHLTGISGSLGIPFHVGGTYVCIEGPQFSTRAESRLYRSWENEKSRISVIGMTALPEAKLAREAGMCYQTVALATDYDCWNETAGDVSVEAVLRVLSQNVAVTRRLIESLASGPIPPCKSHCHELMKNAVITAKEKWPEHRRQELEVVLR